MDSIDSLNTETILIRTGESSLKDTLNPGSIAQENKNEGSDDDDDSEESDKDELNEKGGSIGIQMFAFKSLVATHVNFDNDKFEPLPLLDDDYPNETYDKSFLNINVNLFSETKVYFIPNCRVEVKVIPKLQRRLYNPYSFKMKLKHGDFKWVVAHRNYSKFKELNKDLLKIAEKTLLPGQRLSELEVKENWPMFPVFHENFLLHENDANTKANQIQKYLEKLINSKQYQTNQIVLDFFNISHLSFLNGIGPSLKEGQITKRFYDNVYYGNFRIFKKIWNEHIKPIRDKRWLIVKDTFITYLNPSKGINYLGYVFIIDNSFKCEKEKKLTALYGLSIKSLQRTLFLKFKNKVDQHEWFKRINKRLEITAKEFITKNAIESFAPERKNQLCRWYVNAVGYFEDIMLGLLNAKEEIFITDWWMCPEIDLKRPAPNDNSHRLDQILFKKSNEGVKIYILLFKEVEFALGLLSKRVKDVLTQNGTNKNIRVLRHPLNSSQDILNMTMWSHHEKMVIIDQQVAFAGGIDLCYGRWDDEQHRLVDLGETKNITELKTTNLEKTLADDTEKFLNSFKPSLASAIHSLTNNTIQIITQLDTSNKKHQVTTFSDISEDDIDDEQKKFDLNQSSRHRMKQKIIRKFKKLRHFNEENGSSSSNSSSDEDEKKSKIKFDINNSLVVMDQNKGYYWKGKDYLNTFYEDTREPEKFDKDQYDRKNVHRMPWRDEAFVLFGESARDLARHFIQRWNHAKYELAYSDNFYPYLIPKSYNKQDFTRIDNWFTNSLSKCTVQSARSLYDWSGGISVTEQSIFNAYCDLIKQAEHYIYIENQFFVTTCDAENDGVCKNEVGKALLNRIIEMHENKKSFKVYVVLPLFPGFDNQNSIRAVQYYNLRSIKFGDYSIWKQLEKRKINPSQYITFHGMRNWSVLMGKLKQSIIYVHSKLMIVDDKYVICGSANINDRSLLGKRDSEIACVIKDEEFFDSKLNGKQVKVGKYAFTLRSKIFKLHIGIYEQNPSKIDIRDCASDNFFKLVKDISKHNTDIYDNVFKCDPNSRDISFSEWKLHLNEPKLCETNPVKAEKELKEGVSGFIVDFPLEFLSKEPNFLPELTTAEGIMPKDLWI